MSIYLSNVYINKYATNHACINQHQTPAEVETKLLTKGHIAVDRLSMDSLLDLLCTLYTVYVFYCVIICLILFGRFVCS